MTRWQKFLVALVVWRCVLTGHIRVVGWSWRKGFTFQRTDKPA